MTTNSRLCDFRFIIIYEALATVACAARHIVLSFRLFDYRRISDKRRHDALDRCIEAFAAGRDIYFFLYYQFIYSFITITSRRS